MSGIQHMHDKHGERVRRRCQVVGGGWGWRCRWLAANYCQSMFSPCFNDVPEGACLKLAVMAGRQLEMGFGLPL